MSDDRFNRDRLVTEAVARAGADDFGEDTWQEGLDLLVDGFPSEARLNGVGVEIASGDLVNNLAIRLGIIGWRDEHPEIADVGIERPIVIVGQPRTGTTILYDLLALDPSLPRAAHVGGRSALPPPETATYDTDPRIAEVDETLADWRTHLIPGFTSFHPMGATLAQECVRITAGDFRSMIFPIQFRLRDLQPVAALRCRPRARVSLASVVLAAPAVPAPRSDNGSSSLPRTCGISTSSLASTPTRSSCRPTATR